MPSLNAELFQTLVDLLTPFLPSEHQARMLLTLALGSASPVPGTLDLKGSPRECATVMVQRLSREDLWAVLEKANASADWELTLAGLRDRLFAGNGSVFISYAHVDIATAEKVETALRAAGFAVFIDKTALHGGDWDAMIENALREHDRLVLLLSPHSMPRRKEVHREWFYFDQNRKPIHPILIADCDLHSRMYAYNFRDARADLDAALKQIIADLRLPFQLLTDTAPTDPFDGYRRSAIAELSNRTELDTRFVQLTVLLDRGKDSQETRFIEPPDARRYTDLRALLADVPDKAFVLLGDPGSGKSTLLRRLLLDHSRDRMSDGGNGIAFFVPLNSYRAEAGKPLPAPNVWLNDRWNSLNPTMPALDGLLRAGRVLLLLDALNEMPHLDKDDYRERIAHWQTFLRTALATGSRAVF